MATFLLVHGSWHGGWCWGRLVPLLRSRGHEVHAPTLTGLGERKHLLGRNVDLGTHGTDVAQILRYEDLSDVVLVGHSYGGMVITGVAEQAAPLISRLVYLDAFAPEDGQCAFDVVPELAPRLREAAETGGEGWLIPPPEPGDMGVTDPADASWIKPRLVPMPLRTHEQAVRLESAEAERLPRSYVRCTGSGTFATVAEGARARGWDYHELQTGHDAMITAPCELARLLVKTPNPTTPEPGKPDVRSCRWMLNVPDKQYKK